MLRKSTKKILSLVMVILMFYSLSTVQIFAYTQTDVALGRQVLLDSGWSPEEIDDLLTDEVVANYANATSVGYEKKFYRIGEDSVIEITEEECNEDINNIAHQIFDEVEMIGNGSVAAPCLAPGTDKKDEEITEDGYFTSYVRVYAYGGGDFMLQARFEWLITPSNRKLDVFALRNSISLLPGDRDDIYYVYKADVTNYLPSSQYTATIENPDSMFTDDNGVVITQDLIDDSVLSTATNHRGYVEYPASIANSNALRAAAYSYYYHQETTFEVTPSISFDGPSVTVTPTTKFKFMEPNTYVQFEV